MIVIKCKNKIFNDIPYEQHGGYYYMFVRDDWRLLANNYEELENRCDCVIECDNDCYLLIKKPVPFDLQRSEIRGEPIILADNNEWIIPTIADVRYKFVLKKQQGQYIQSMEVCDPLFDLLIEYAEKIKQGVDYYALIDLISKVLERNYYVNKNIVLALGLIDTYNIEKIIKVIYRYDEMRRLNEGFFRASNDVDEIKSISNGLSNSKNSEDNVIKSEGSDNQ